MVGQESTLALKLLNSFYQGVNKSCKGKEKYNVSVVVSSSKAEQICINAIMAIGRPITKLQRWY